MGDGAKVQRRVDADRVQRERQQGLGNPITSTNFKGHRFVAVKNRLLHSKGWLTFHDFLFDYIKMAFGFEWGNSELAKPVEQRHPVLIWYQKSCEQQRRCIKEEGKVSGARMNGAIASYLHLAYDLYSLDHNAELQEKLISRLKHSDQFPGARYEVYVAAAFIRAGCDLRFENEDDRRTTHCEFTATYRPTGKSFSVEVKRREGRRPRIGHLLNSALSKSAAHARIVFIDINMRDDAIDESEPGYRDWALRALRSCEGKLLNGQP
jgi:hypothetical protein